VKRITKVFFFLKVGLAFFAALGTAYAQTARPTVLPSSNGPPMTFKIARDAQHGCEPTCIEWISAIGEIKPETAGVFRRFLKAAGSQKRLLLVHSPGGSIEAAIEMAQMIRQRDMHVMVARTHFLKCHENGSNCATYLGEQDRFATALTAGAKCNSSCGLVLAGGKTRIVARDSHVGVHMPKRYVKRQMVRTHFRIVTRQAEDGRIVREKQIQRTEILPGTKLQVGSPEPALRSMEQHFAAMGIGDGIMGPLRKTPHEKVYYLSANELDLYGIRNVTDAATYLATLRSVARNARTATATQPAVAHVPMGLAPEKKTDAAALPPAPVETPRLSHELRTSGEFYIPSDEGRSLPVVMEIGAVTQEGRVDVLLRLARPPSPPALIDRIELVAPNRMTLSLRPNETGTAYVGSVLQTFVCSANAGRRRMSAMIRTYNPALAPLQKHALLETRSFANHSEFWARLCG